MKAMLAFLLTALLAIGCTVVNPTVGQLATFKADAARGDYQAIAAAPVDCGADQEGCSQLRWIKADACYRLARDAPAQIKRERLDCAAENYAAALAALARRPDPVVDRSAVELGVLDSLQKRRELGGDVDRVNAILAAQAATVRLGPNANPAGLYYGADAELNTVLRRGPQGGCAEIGEAARLLRGARAQGTVFADPVARLNGAIINARNARGCGA